MPRRLLDSDPQRERRRQLLLLDRISRAAERRITSEIASATRKMLKEWEATGQVKPSPEHSRAIYSQLKTMWNSSIRVMGERIMQQGKAAGYILEQKDNHEDMFELFVSQYIADVGGDLIAEDISRTTVNHIKKQVAMGREQGLGQREIARNITDNIATISRQRAAVIARTETHSAGNYSAQQSAKRTGLPMRREWIAASGGRTRDSHRDADGQVVGMDEPFRVGGARLMYPGDPSGPADETINCRCAVGFIVED